MRSSTNIQIKCPLLTDEQLDELLDILEGLDDENLKKEYWQISNKYNYCSISIEENGVGYDVAEILGDVILDNFFSEYFIGQICSVEVSYEQMNADGSYEWNIYCEGDNCLFETKQAIYSESVTCNECFKFFDIDFDFDKFDAFEELEFYGEDKLPEEKVICPYCGAEHIRKGNWLILRHNESWE